jgi:hypothetical protein
MTIHQLQRIHKRPAFACIFCSGTGNKGRYTNCKTLLNPGNYHCSPSTPTIRILAVVSYMFCRPAMLDNY